MNGVVVVLVSVVASLNNPILRDFRNLFNELRRKLRIMQLAEKRLMDCENCLKNTENISVHISSMSCCSIQMRLVAIFNCENLYQSLSLCEEF